MKWVGNRKGAAINEALKHNVTVLVEWLAARGEAA